MMKPTIFLSILILGGVFSVLNLPFVWQRNNPGATTTASQVGPSQRQPASVSGSADSRSVDSRSATSHASAPAKWSALDPYFLPADQFFGSEDVSHRRLVDYAIEVIPVHSAMTAVHRAEIQGSLFMDLRISYSDEERDPIMRLSLELNGQRLDLVRGLEATRISTATGRPYTMFDLSTLPPPWSQHLAVILAAWPDGSDNRGDIKLLRASPRQWASVSLGSWMNESSPSELAMENAPIHASR